MIFQHISSILFGVRDGPTQLQGDPFDFFFHAVDLEAEAIPTRCRECHVTPVAGRWSPW